MAEAAWRARFRERVVETAIRMERVRGDLAAELPHLAAPVLVGDAEATRARIQLALGALGEASNDLALAICVMMGAELLVFSEGNPLRINHLGGQYLAERIAGTKLRDTGEVAQEAFAMVDDCRSHLDAVLLLLDHSGIPDVDAVIEEERIAAVGDLKAAIVNVELSSEKAAAARQDVSGAS